MDAFSFHRKHISGSPSSLEISRKAFPVLCQLFLSLVVNIALDNIAFLLILVRVCLVQEGRGTEPSGPVFALRVSERSDSFEGIFAQYSG